MITRERLSEERQRETRRKDRRKTSTQKRVAVKPTWSFSPKEVTRVDKPPPRLWSAPITDEWHRTVAPHHRKKRDRQKQEKGKERPAGAKKERPKQPPEKPEPNPQKDSARRPQSPPERPSPQLRQVAPKPPQQLHQQYVVSPKARNSMA